MKNTFRPAKILTAAQVSANLAKTAELRARRAALRVQIAAEIGNPMAAYTRAVIAEANRRLKAAA